MEDFATLQLCYAPSGIPVPPVNEYCVCFDVRADSGEAGADADVDQYDVAAFVACTTGPGVPFKPGNPPPG